MAGRYAKWSLLVATAGATVALLVATGPLARKGSLRGSSMTRVRPVATIVETWPVERSAEIGAEEPAELAVDRAREALKRAEEASPPDDRALASALYDAAGTLSERGYSDEAVTLIARSLAILEAKFGDNPLVAAQALERMSVIHWYRGEMTLAEPPLRRALAIRDKVTSPPDLLVAQDLKDLVILCRDQGRYAEAEPMARRMVAIVERLEGPASNRLAIYQHFLGNIALKLGNHAEAQATFRRALAILEANPDVEVEAKVRCLRSLSEVATAEGRTEDFVALKLQADDLETQARPVSFQIFNRETQPKADPPKVGNFPSFPADIGVKKTSADDLDSLFPRMPPE